MATDMDAQPKRSKLWLPNPYPDEHAKRVRRDLSSALRRNAALEGAWEEAIEENAQRARKKMEDREQEVEQKEEAAKPRIRRLIERIGRMSRKMREQTRSVPCHHKTSSLYK